MAIIEEYCAGTAGNDDRCKSAWSIVTIDPLEQDMFDDKVITTGNSYEPISTTEYFIAPSISNSTINCNKGSYNLLKQAGVSVELLKEIGDRLPGIIWGWGQNMPWTQEEQYNDYINRTWGE